MATLEEVAVLENRIFFRDRGDGKKTFHYPDEREDGILNDVTRMKIEAFAEKHGGCWLGRVNYYKKFESIMWLYDGGLVCNFEASFALPKYDAILHDMILRRELDPYKGTMEDSLKVERIYSRINALGGVFLHWV